MAPVIKARLAERRERVWQVEDELDFFYRWSKVAGTIQAEEPKHGAYCTS